MRRDVSNTWLGRDEARIEFYLNIADLVLVERKRTIKILTDLFRYQFGDRTGLSLLDLGCGDGIVTRRIRDTNPQHTFHLMDASAQMLEKARKNLDDGLRDLGDGSVSFINQTFEEYIDAPPNTMRYDFVYSANAIHHLDLEGKGRLYAKIFQEVRTGGAFINIDVVKPSSRRCEEWQFRMWTDWINETLRNRGLKQDIGKYDHIPGAYKTAKENKPSTLNEQLDLLSRIGFEDVDCHYKYGIFAIFGGTKKEK